MYFNPSWSLAHSAFGVALFTWYGDKTRDSRTRHQWILLGLIAGLMVDVYYVSAVVLLLPLLESVARLRAPFDEHKRTAQSLIFDNVSFASAALLAFVPTLITKKIVFGSYFNFGYTEHRLGALWSWRRTVIAATASISIFIPWNFGMMYQWGVHLIPARGPISWREAVHNQFAVVPGQFVRNLEDYLMRRRSSCSASKRKTSSNSNRSSPIEP